MFAPRPRSAALTSLALGALLALVSGCAASRDRTPAPLELPTLVARSSQRCGAPLGPLAAPGSADELAARVEPGWIARVNLVATEFAPEALPSVALSPLGASARLISAELGGAAVEPRVLLADGAWRVETPTSQLSAAPQLGRTRALDQFEGALPSGATLRLEWRSTANGAARALRVELGRESSDSNGADLALVFEGEIEFDHDSDPSTPDVRTLRREALALERRVTLGADGVAQCVLPSPFAGGEARGLLLEIAIEARDDAAALAAAIERCRMSERGAADTIRMPIDQELRTTRLKHWVAALALDGDARAALLELASLGGAELTVDLALCASDADLTSLAQAVAQTLAEPDALAGELAALGWRIERATLTWLAAQKDSRALGYELEGVLVRRTGELGRSAAGLAAVAAASSSIEHFAQRVREENWSFLDDHSTATRVRACDWLAARGWAPAGYDPMAERSVRRAALEAADSAR